MNPPTDSPALRPTPAAPPWRRYPLDVDSAAAQIARSAALLAGTAPLPALRWYWAREPSLILGVFQNEEFVNRAACAARGIPVLHRRSGGTGVLAGPALLSLDIALPPEHPLALPDVTESYHWLGRAWIATLETLGVYGARLVPIAEVRGSPPYRAPRHLPADGVLSDEDLVRLACFGALSPYEVAVGPRKLVGFSQVRRRAGVLWQVGLPLTWQAEILAETLSSRPADRARLAGLLQARACGLDSLVPTVPAAAAIMATFESVLAAGWGVRIAPAPGAADGTARSAG